MVPEPDFNTLVPTTRMQGESRRETKELRSMLAKAREYISSFNWCPDIAETYLGIGIGGVVAVFLFQFTQKINGTDGTLWVVVGDVPSAYMVTDQAPDARAALGVYCDLMEAWAKAVIEGKPTSNAYPVEAEPTTENAASLLSRIEFLRGRILPAV